MESCIFCDIITGSHPGFQVWEDDRFVAFLDINPVNAGHTLLVTKEHHEDVFKLDEETYLAIFNAAKKLVPLLQEATNAKRVALAVEGLAVPHLHIHLVPVHNSNELDPTRARRATPEELEAMQKVIRAKI